MLMETKKKYSCMGHNQEYQSCMAYEKQWKPIDKDCRGPSGSARLNLRTESCFSII